jgi:hypothetical protein
VQRVHCTRSLSVCVRAVGRVFLASLLHARLTSHESRVTTHQSHHHQPMMMMMMMTMMSHRRRRRHQSTASCHEFSVLILRFMTLRTAFLLSKLK